MHEQRKNFSEDLNEQKLRELKDYVLEIKNLTDQFYDPKVHSNWEETKILIDDTPLKWCVFKVHIKTEDIFIYNFSDQDGSINLPLNLETEEYDVEVIYTNNESSPFDKQEEDTSNWKIEVGGILLALLIGYMSFILPNQIRQYRLNEEQELINSVVSKPYADFENYRTQIINRIELLKQQNPFIYVYTNDTEPLEFSISPNVSVYQNENNYVPHFSVKQMQADDLKYFLDNEGTEGYNIWLNTGKNNIAIGNYNDNTATEFNVCMSYFYTKETKKHLKQQAEKRKSHIDSIQTARVTISEDFKLKPKNSLVGMLMKFDEKIIQSAIKKKNPTRKIYFSFYSKNGSKEELESKIKEFETLFFNGKKSKGYTIRKVYLKN